MFQLLDLPTLYKQRDNLMGLYDKETEQLCRNTTQAAPMHLETTLQRERSSMQKYSAVIQAREQNVRAASETLEQQCEQVRYR